MKVAAGAEDGVDSGYVARAGGVVEDALAGRNLQTATAALRSLAQFEEAAG